MKRKSKQIQLLEELVTVFSNTDTIHSVVVRGSISKGLSDKYSDVDLLLITDNDDFINTVKGLPSILGKHVNLITPNGWIDTNVPNFGGIGYVYLVKYKGDIVQLDVYILPEENSNKIWSFSDKIVKFTQKSINYKETVDLSSHSYSAQLREIVDDANSDFQIFFDILLHFEMLSKYICRQNAFLACKYWYLINSKMMLLIRNILEPETSDFMFYDVKRHLSKYQYGKLDRFERQLEQANSIYDFSSFIDLYKLYKSIIKEHYPLIFNQNKELIDELQLFMKTLYNEAVKTR